MMPQGGAIGEAWIFPRALSAAEIKADYQAKQAQYSPAPAGAVVKRREINLHPATGLWPVALTREIWPAQRERVLAGVMQILGPFPQEIVPLDPRQISEEDCGDYIRRKVSIQVQPDDRMPLYLLIPKHRQGRVPAIICVYGTTAGAGKETTVGLSGGAPGSPPVKNRNFAVTMVRAGFVALAADYLRDGERIKPGRRPYDTTGYAYPACVSRYFRATMLYRLSQWRRLLPMALGFCPASPLASIVVLTRSFPTCSS